MSILNTEISVEGKARGDVNSGLLDYWGIFVPYNPDPTLRSSPVSYLLIVGRNRTDW